MLHAVAIVAPAKQKEPGGQSKHEALDSRLEALPKEPEAQGSASLAPSLQ